MKNKISMQEEIMDIGYGFQKGENKVLWLLFLVQDRERKFIKKFENTVMRYGRIII